MKLRLSLEPIPLSDLAEEDENEESSAVIRQRVIKAREIQDKRYYKVKGVSCNARMPDKEIANFCSWDPVARRFLLNRWKSSSCRCGI